MSTLTMTRAAPYGADQSSPTSRLRRFLRTPKGSLTTILLPLLLIAAPGVGWPAAPPHITAALIGACLVELLIIWIGRRARRGLTSALLSGLIVAFVRGPETSRLSR